MFHIFCRLLDLLSFARCRMYNGLAKKVLRVAFLVRLSQVQRHDRPVHRRNDPLLVQATGGQLSDYTIPVG